MKDFDIPRIMKFGGSSFATQAHFAPVCKWIAQCLNEGGPRQRIVCVVSAPSGLTEQYRETLMAINPTPSERLIDAGLPLADSLGAVLVAAALQAQGVSATVTLGNQIGLRTDTNYTRARLQSVDVAPLSRLLSMHQVVVVPGGQASAEDTGETTWLGKNSSDLSAMALAAALGCTELEIYSDVPGVYDCDPNIVDSAALLPRLAHAQAIEMSVSGAKVLHHRAVEHALQHRLRIVCRRNHGDFGVGTVLEADGPYRPAVVPDARSQVFSATPSTISEAMELLTAAGVPCIALPSADKSPRHLAVTCGFFDAWHFLVNERRLPLSRETTRLLSVVRSDASVLRELVPATSLARRARQRHGAHCVAAATPGMHQRRTAALLTPPAGTAPLAAALAALPKPEGRAHV